MFEKLAQIEKSYDELTEQISQPEFMSDMSVYAKLMKQHRSLSEIVEKYREVRRMQEELAGAKEMAAAADDEEMRELALAEASEIEEKLPAAEEELKFLLLPKDPNDEKNVILEIRAGTGGDEATLLRGRDPAYVRPLRRASGLENGDPGSFGHGRWRDKGSGSDDRGRSRIFENAIRIGRTSRAACAANRDCGTDPYVGDHSRRFAGGRRGRRADQPERPSHRYILLVGSRRAVGEYHLLRRANNTSAH